VVPVSTLFTTTDTFSRGKVFEIAEVHHGMYETTEGYLVFFEDAEEHFILESVYKSKLYRALK
jgi:hypothetical protein